MAIDLQSSSTRNLGGASSASLGGMAMAHRRSAFWLVVVLGICVVFGASAPARAQSTAALQGTVLDPQGNSVPKAQVTVRNTQTGVERTTQTDDAGLFQVSLLRVGTYRVEIRHDGFRTLVVPK